MEKVDFKRTLKHLYQPTGKEFSLVDVPPMQSLMLDGHGDPEYDGSTAQDKPRRQRR
jgi:hypothetical protein